MARCQSLGLSVRKAELAKTELVNKGLAKEIGAKLGKSKRLTKFLVLTELGSKLLRKAGYDTGLWKRTGYQNFEHQLYSVLIVCLQKSGPTGLHRKSRFRRKTCGCVSFQRKADCDRSGAWASMVVHVFKSHPARL